MVTIVTEAAKARPEAAETVKIAVWLDGSIMLDRDWPADDDCHKSDDYVWHEITFVGTDDLDSTIMSL